MFQNLLHAVKQRILNEAEAAFLDHPAFSSKVKVFNKFPYEERVQFGIILRNSAASQIRLGADNFMSDLFSHLKLTRQDNYPAIAIEWVREDEGYITQYITGEDVSNQLGATQRQFMTDSQICAGPGETHFADSPGQVEVFVNGSQIIPESVDGINNKVLLYNAPGNNSVVTINYHIRRIALPGLYIVDFTEDTQYTVSIILTINKEVVIAKTTGVESTASLAHQNIDPDSETLYLTYTDGTIIDRLARGTDYTLNNVTGVITFLSPLLSNYSILADYFYIPANSFLGPLSFNIYQENHTVIPGVIFCMGRRAKKGDQQVIQVTQFREQQAKIYGGHWQMSFDLSVIAKDPIQMAEMSDQLINWLWAIRKNQLEFEGITLNSVEPSGESEEAHIEITGDVYYESSIAVNVQTEWQNFVPYDFYVSIKNPYLYPDLRPTFKGPIVGYERLT